MNGASVAAAVASVGLLDLAKNGVLWSDEEQLRAFYELFEKTPRSEGLAHDIVTVWFADEKLNRHFDCVPRGSGASLSLLHYVGEKFQTEEQRVVLIEFILSLRSCLSETCLILNQVLRKIGDARLARQSSVVVESDELDGWFAAGRRTAILNALSEPSSRRMLEIMGILKVEFVFCEGTEEGEATFVLKP